VVSILINNAGIVSGSALLDTPDSKLDRFIVSRKKDFFFFLKIQLAGSVIFYPSKL
jgi:hypothetical protein